MIRKRLLKFPDVFPTPPWVKKSGPLAILEKMDIEMICGLTLLPSYSLNANSKQVFPDILLH